MAHAALAPGIGREFDPFLFASIGDGRQAIVRRASTKQYHGANFIRQWLVAEFLRHFSDAFDCGGFDVAGSLIAVLTI
jgi:hypothetical protein